MKHEHEKGDSPPLQRTLLVQSGAYLRESQLAAAFLNRRGAQFERPCADRSAMTTWTISPRISSRHLETSQEAHPTKMVAAPRVTRATRPEATNVQIPSRERRPGRVLYSWWRCCCSCGAVDCECSFEMSSGPLLFSLLYSTSGKVELTGRTRTTSRTYAAAAAAD